MKSPDHTMEELLRVARSLRRDHGFAGYIHLKAIPEASPWLVEQAGRWADRLSINLELPTEASLARLAPEKRAPSIAAAMGQMHDRIIEAKAEKRRFAPAGQSTQVIVGADKELNIVGPRLVVALGATAVLALAGKPLPITANRGETRFDNRLGYITVHPSYLLRLPDEAAKREAYAAFRDDLTRIREIAKAA